MSNPHPPEGAPPTPAQSTSVFDPVPGPTIPPVGERTDVGAPLPGALTGEQARPRNPLEDVKPERPRTHPVAYAALALGALSLLLSLLAMRDDDRGYRQVRIGTNDCVIGHQDDADVLYCRAPAVP